MPPKKVARKTTQRGVEINEKPVKNEFKTNSKVLPIPMEMEESSEMEKCDQSVIKVVVKEINKNAATPSLRIGRKRKTAEIHDSKSTSVSSVKGTRTGRIRLKYENYLPKEFGDRVLSCGEGEQLGHPGRLATRKPRAIDSLPEGKKIVQVVAGGVHSVILLEDGSIYTCGINEKGTAPAEGVEAEGSSDHLAPIIFANLISQHGKIVMVAAGASFSAGLTDKGSVIAWGNLRGTSGCIESHKILVEMEEHPVVIIDHKNRVIVKIAAGENHLVMLSQYGELLTFGDGSMGQLGRSVRLTSIRSQQMVDDSGISLLVSVKEKRKQKLVVFNDIMAGGYWTAARATDDRLFVCGLNNFGQLGVDLPEMDQLAKPGESEPELRIMRPTVAVAFESYKINQLSGIHHIILLDDSGDVYGIGKNTDNALGIGTWTGKDDDDHWRYTKPQKISLPKASGVCAKLGCSVAWTSEGVAYSWGYDTSGQLGLGIKDDVDKIVPFPRKITSAHLDGYHILSCSIADNHTLFLAKKI